LALESREFACALDGSRDWSLLVGLQHSARSCKERGPSVALVPSVRLSPSCAWHLARPWQPPCSSAGCPRIEQHQGEHQQAAGRRDQWSSRVMALCALGLLFAVVISDHHLEQLLRSEMQVVQASQVLAVAWASQQQHHPARAGSCWHLSVCHSCPQAQLSRASCGDSGSPPPIEGMILQGARPEQSQERPRCQSASRAHWHTDRRGSSSMT